jgi:hypothetical protein
MTENLLFDQNVFKVVDRFNKMKYNTTFILACSYGHLSLAKMTSKKISNSNHNLSGDDVIFFAVQGVFIKGHQNIIDWFLLMFVDNKNNNNSYLIKNNLNYIIYSNNVDLIIFVIEKFKADADYLNVLNNALCYACKFGNKKIVESLVRLGANDWDHGFVWACKGGHLDIIQLMNDSNGTQNIEEMFDYCKRIDVVLSLYDKYFIENNSKDNK